jgi:hypothetical protein
MNNGTAGLLIVYGILLIIAFWLYWWWIDGPTGEAGAPDMPRTTKPRRHAVESSMNEVLVMPGDAAPPAADFG